MLNNAEYFTTAVKTGLEGDLQCIIPADISSEITNKMKSKTLEIAKFLNLKGCGRLDFILDGDDFYLLEINPLPDISDHGPMPGQLEAAGLTMTDMFNDILEDAGN